MVEYDEELAQQTERMYLMAASANQRACILMELQLQAGETVLDIGCGMGLLARDLALAVGQSGKVVGIDNSEAMIALAQNRCAAVQNIELRTQSAEAQPDPDDSYDVITCTQLLLYLPDVAAALAEMYRVLKPDGRIAIVETDWRGSVYNTMDDALMKKLLDSWEAEVPSPHLPGQLQGLLKRAGFKAIRVEAIPIIDTSYVEDNYSVGFLDYMLKNQLAAGTISQSNADTYVLDLQERSKLGDYFFCVNRFLFTAVK